MIIDIKYYSQNNFDIFSEPVATVSQNYNDFGETLILQF